MRAKLVIFSLFVEGGLQWFHTHEYTLLFVSKLPPILATDLSDKARWLFERNSVKPFHASYMASVQRAILLPSASPEECTHLFHSSLSLFLLFDFLFPFFQPVSLSALSSLCLPLLWKTKSPGKFLFSYLPVKDLLKLLLLMRCLFASF